MPIDFGNAGNNVLNKIKSSNNAMIILTNPFILSFIITLIIILIVFIIGFATNKSITKKMIYISIFTGMTLVSFLSLQYMIMKDNKNVSGRGMEFLGDNDIYSPDSINIEPSLGNGQLNENHRRKAAEYISGNNNISSESSGSIRISHELKKIGENNTKLNGSLSSKGEETQDLIDNINKIIDDKPINGSQISKQISLNENSLNNISMQNNDIEQSTNYSEIPNNKKQSIQFVDNTGKSLQELAKYNNANGINLKKI